MAVPSTVAFLRQVQGVVESPELLKENNCVDEVVSFLDSSLENPDSRARLSAARALAQLAAHLGSEDRGCLKLHHAPKVLARAQLQSTTDAVDAELNSLLATVLGDQDGQLPKVTEKDAKDVPRAPRGVPHVVRLNVCLDMDDTARTAVCQALDDTARTAVRQALVQMGGVVSVTFETGHRSLVSSAPFRNVSPSLQIVVGARGSELVSDPAFVEDIRTTAEEELRRLGGTEHVKVSVASGMEDLVPTVASRRYSSGGSGNHGRCPDEEDTHTNNFGQPETSPWNEGETVEDEEDDEPMYLDDSEDESPEALPTEFGKSFSFFSPAGLFLTSHRLQGFEEDPSLMARLQKARARCERRRLQEQMRLSRVLSVITPSRARAMAVAAERGTSAFEPPGVE